MVGVNSSRTYSSNKMKKAKRDAFTYAYNYVITTIITITELLTTRQLFLLSLVFCRSEYIIITFAEKSEIERQGKKMNPSTVGN